MPDSAMQTFRTRKGVRFSCGWPPPAFAPTDWGDMVPFDPAFE